MTFVEWFMTYSVLIIPIVGAVIGVLYAIFLRYKKSIADELSARAKQVAEDLKESDHKTAEACREVKLYASSEIQGVWAEIRAVLAMQSKHTSDIAVLTVEQKNTWARLEEIKDLIGKNNDKIDRLVNELVHAANQKGGMHT